jgi:hypothetical protein
VLGYKAVSGSPFPGYAGEVRLTPAGAGNHISYTVSSTASFPFDDAHKAADYLRSSQAIGKIVLEMKEQL